MHGPKEIEKIDSAISIPIIKSKTTKAGHGLLPSVQEFKEFIECDSRLLTYFHQMWQQQNKREYAGHVTVTDYEHMFEALNTALQTAPSWSQDMHKVGSAGLPICDIFYYAVATPSGYAAFTDPGVVAMLKRMLCEWGRRLMQPESGSTLHTWLGRSGGYDVLTAAANEPMGTNLPFEALFKCKPDEPNLGFKSWDDFFIREFQDGARPLAFPDDDSIIANACESKRYNLARNAQMRDKFWIKGNFYSLMDMFKSMSIARSFEGGTVYQAFLSTYSYHRWHAPVSGTVKFAYELEGSYFTIPEFADSTTRANRVDELINPEEWQAWLASVGTRGIVVIEADNVEIGLVGFIAIGMVEVSTVELTAKEGQRVQKGDEIGMFHFGGSSHCLLFQRGVNVDHFPPDHGEQAKNFPVKGAVARVYASHKADKA